MASSRSYSAAPGRWRPPSATGSSAWRSKAEAEPASRTGPEDLKALLERVIGSLGAQGKLAECRAILAWPEAVGPMLARHTQPLRVANGRLEVAVPAPVWRNQLSLMQRDIVLRLNRTVGSEVITALVLLNRERREPTPVRAISRTTSEKE